MSLPNEMKGNGNNKTNRSSDTVKTTNIVYMCYIQVNNPYTIMLIPAVWLGHLVFAPHCLNFTQRCEEHGQTELRLRKMKAFDVRVCHLAFHVVFPRPCSDVFRCW